jgi:DnaK suppressor protein
MNVQTSVKRSPGVGKKTEMKNTHQISTTNGMKGPIEKKYYSSEELKEFRKIIIDKLDQAKKNYELLKSTLCYESDNGTDDTSPTFKVMEDGSSIETKEEVAQLAFRQEKFIRELQNALIRIENRTYGICRITGKLIPKERLLLVPHATLTVNAKLEQ